MKRGAEVILPSASGTDFKVPVLKQIALGGTWKSQNGEVAMSRVAKHQECLECYARHADRAAQCYGCDITVYDSEGKTDIDWINNANTRREDGLTADNALGTNRLTSAGEACETRSYLRWEGADALHQGRGSRQPADARLPGDHHRHRQGRQDGPLTRPGSRPTARRASTTQPFSRTPPDARHAPAKAATTLRRR